MMKLKPMKARCVLRAADRYECSDCGSTAYSVETVYRGRTSIYSWRLPRFAGDALLASLATPVALRPTREADTGARPIPNSEGTTT